MAEIMAGRPALDLAAHGYLEEEDILSGVAGAAAYNFQWAWASGHAL